jgi:hypothetical protein
MDFLAKYAIQIDFDRGRIAFLRSGVRASGLRLPLQLAARSAIIPCVMVQLDKGISEWFQVDTGWAHFTSGSLERDTFRAVERGGLLTPAGRTKGYTAGGTLRSDIGRLQRMKLGPFEHHGLYFVQGRAGLPPTLGLGFWERYHVTFDFQARAVYLRKSRRHSVSDYSPDGSGLTVFLRKGLAIVEDIEMGSPAAKAGIRKGDEVISIAGRKAAGANLIVLRRLFCGERRTVRLVVRRGEEKREVALRLDLAWRTDKTKP